MPSLVLSRQSNGHRFALFSVMLAALPILVATAAVPSQGDDDGFKQFSDGIEAQWAPVKKDLDAANDALDKVLNRTSGSVGQGFPFPSELKAQIVSVFKRIGPIHVSIMSQTRKFYDDSYFGGQPHPACDSAIARAAADRPQFEDIARKFEAMPIGTKEEQTLAALAATVDLGVAVAVVAHTQMPALPCGMEKTKQALQASGLMSSERR